MHLLANACLHANQKVYTTYNFNSRINTGWLLNVRG